MNDIMTIPNDEGKKYFLNEHFLYEVLGIIGARQLMAFANTSYFLNPLDSNKYLTYKNISLDNMFLHSRNLLEFFFYSPDKEEKTARASDFIPTWKIEMSPEIKLFNERVHGEIIHLGWARLDKGPATKGWDLNKLASEFIYISLDFMDKIRTDVKYYGEGLKILEGQLHAFPI
jgi:sensor histidine kinase YesM